MTIGYYHKSVLYRSPGVGKSRQGPRHTNLPCLAAARALDDLNNLQEALLAEFQGQVVRGAGLSNLWNMALSPTYK